MHSMDLVEAAAEKIDLSKIPNKADEMNRLFGEAEYTLVNLLAFAKKSGVIVGDGRVLEYALHTLAAVENENRVVSSMWAGRLADIQVANLDSFEASKRALAERFGVTIQDVARYEQYPHELGIEVECNHAAGCRRSKSLFYGDPAEMVRAERQSACEVWYCFDHRESAFKSGGALSDEMFPILHRIKAAPGLTQKDTGAKREDLAFLEAIGLVRIDKISHGGRTLVYRICLTEAGGEVLANAVGESNMESGYA